LADSVLAFFLLTSIIYHGFSTCPTQSCQGNVKANS
jgi:hypothetical protein